MISQVVYWVLRQPLHIQVSIHPHLWEITLCGSDPVRLLLILNWCCASVTATNVGIVGCVKCCQSCCRMTLCVPLSPTSSHSCTKIFSIYLWFVYNTTNRHPKCQSICGRLLCVMWWLCSCGRHNSHTQQLSSCGHTSTHTHHNKMNIHINTYMNTYTLQQDDVQID